MNTELIVGPGGCGKSTLLRERIVKDPQYALLTASTGIAAVNLGEGVTTIHSALGFYNLASLRDAHKYGKIARKVRELSKKGIKNVVLDECSMFGAESLELLYDGFVQAANSSLEHGDTPTGLVLTGDFCQLAPISDDRKASVKYAFESSCWDRFENNMTKMTKIYRQNNEKFLAALQLIRAGRGVDGAIELRQCGVEFASKADEQFDGVTLFATNTEVQGYNEGRLSKMPGDPVYIYSQRWGKEKGEWKHIPNVLELKDGALVMVLVNQPREFQYVNGDLALFNAGSNDLDNYTVTTKRGYTGSIPFVVRRNITYNENEFCAGDVDYYDDYLNSLMGSMLESTPRDSKKWTALYLQYMANYTMREVPYYDPREKGLVIGEIRYLPLRLAYGSSFHKVQGLTLDKVQVHISNFWCGNPGMIYVALTRCRTPEGIRIVGDVGQLARRVKTAKQVMRWV